MFRQPHVFRRLARIRLPHDVRDDYESDVTRTFGAQQHAAATLAYAVAPRIALRREQA